MSLRMYKPENSNSRIYLYIFIFASFLLGSAFFIYTRPLVVESVCSDISQKTTGLTTRYNYDPLADYDYSKAKCLEEVLSASK